MPHRRYEMFCAIAICMGGWVMPASAQSVAASEAQSLRIGDTFTLESKTLGETRRINVYLPAGYAEHPEARVPVLYMPDGGLAEDFLHVAGLMQVSMANGTMRPFLLVGIENTQRRRDLTPPSERPEDRGIAPAIGGAAAFRAFLRDELMPEIARRYRTTDETAIVGESLAGLFVVETFVREPTLFDHYIAIDPSLWWNGRRLIEEAPAAARRNAAMAGNLWLAHGGAESNARETSAFFAAATAADPDVATGRALRIVLDPLPDETHATIYHPAALRAFRALFAPTPEK
jgi:hypothetical protein